MSSRLLKNLPGDKRGSTIKWALGMSEMLLQNVKEEKEGGRLVALTREWATKSHQKGLEKAAVINLSRCPEERKLEREATGIFEDPQAGRTGMRNQET